MIKPVESLAAQSFSLTRFQEVPPSFFSFNGLTALVLCRLILCCVFLKHKQGIITAENGEKIYGERIDFFFLLISSILSVDAFIELIVYTVNLSNYVGYGVFHSKPNLGSG